MKNCPFCGASSSIVDVPTPQGTDAFILAAVNTTEANHILHNGLIVSVKSCIQCKSIILSSDK